MKIAIYGKGIYEKGLHVAKKNGKHTKEYLVWRTMISRCYNPMYLKKHLSYEKCEVCDEWLYFQDFCKWFDENYYEIDNEIMNLDKDFLCGIKNIKNKIYSPDTCIFIPQEINKTIIHQWNKTTNLPTGVKRTKSKNIYAVNVGKCYVGDFVGIKESFNQYIIAKNKDLINKVNYYRNIPLNVKNVIIEYVDKNIFEKDCLNKDGLN